MIRPSSTSAALTILAGVGLLALTACNGDNGSDNALSAGSAGKLATVGGGAGSASSGGSGNPPGSGGAAGSGGTSSAGSASAPDATWLPDPSWSCGMPDGLAPPTRGELVFNASFDLGDTHDACRCRNGRGAQSLPTGGSLRSTERPGWHQRSLLSNANSDSVDHAFGVPATTPSPRSHPRQDRVLSPKAQQGIRRGASVAR
jgi:hypothetical protein